jgi:predicted nucleic acid-binding protein
MSRARLELGLDADVLMNLVATDQLDAVLAASGFTGLIAPKTEAEALYLNPRTAGRSPDPIDLSSLIAASVLRRTALTDDEVREFVALAREVDDGEAQVLAICSKRGIAVATDDQKARRIATERGIRLMGTPELIIQWAAGAESVAAAAAIQDVEARARFRPRPSDPLRAEWDRLKGGA